MFVALLVLIARTGRRTLITVTGFTLAHSLTLALSTLELISLPIPAVEAAIALSIVFVATEIARKNEKTLTYRYPVLVASSFGLLHGFGFASVLREVGLPATELPTALLFFNVGVEIGQIAFVLIIFGVTYSARTAGQRLSARTETFNLSNAKTSAVTAYTVGAVASFWTLERILAFWT
jgi:hydrogenase/urease accessory protein HupE